MRWSTPYATASAPFTATGFFMEISSPRTSYGPRTAAPRLVDFGASKILGLDRLTATGEISGTPAYMGARGIDRKVGGR